MARVAGQDGDETADLIARTADRPSEAEFFQTVRLILRAARRAGAARARLGGEARPVAEPVRLRAAAGMRFAAAEITAAAEATQGAKPELTVAFMGLTGPSGVLPDHYSDLLVQRRRARDPALAEFLDLFNHRSLSLFYRAWAKPRLPVRYEEADRPFADPFSSALASAMGLGLGAQQAQASLGDGGLLGLAGSLGRRVRTPGAVRRLAAALLNAPVQIAEFHGRWIAIAPGERTRLAGPRPGERTFSRLGEDAVAGVQAWDVQGRFRLRVGPLSLEDFRTFLQPDGPRALLDRVVREAVGPAVDFDLQLVLRADEVPSLKLDDPEAPALLSQTTWLGRGPAGRDRDEAVLPSGAAARS